MVNPQIGAKCKGIISLFTADSTECHKCVQYYWSTEMRDGCVPMPEVFLAFFDPLALALLACVLLGNVLTMAIGLQMFLYHNLPIMKDTDLTVWIPLLFSIFSCFISSLSLMGQPSGGSCRFHEAPACACLTMAHICVINMTLQLVKTSKCKINCLYTNVSEFVPPFCCI